VEENKFVETLSKETSWEKSICKTDEEWEDNINVYNDASFEAFIAVM
jgi:hypothetical protein